ncbi:MAG: hypothetical protein Fur0012_11490 [Elusimicrobiota bacterium]
MKYLKILNIIDIPWASALADYAIAQAKALKEAGHEIIFAAPVGSFSATAAKKNGFKLIDFPDRKKILSPLKIISLSYLCSKEKIDIINAHTGRALSAASAISVFTTGVKIVRTKADAKKPSSRFFSRNLSLIICGSAYIREMYGKQAEKTTKLKVIYKGAEKISRTPFQPAPPYRIGIIGRLDPVKGHADFIKAAILLLEKRKDCFFLIAGQEENISWGELKKLIPAEFEKNFSYLGRVSDPYSFTSSCHFGVISSLASEAVSRAALEWLSSSRALISSSAGSLPEFVNQDFLYRPGDWKTLAKKMENILQAEKFREEGINNLNKTEKFFSAKKFSMDTAEAFSMLV